MQKTNSTKNNAKIPYLYNVLIGPYNTLGSFIFHNSRKVNIINTFNISESKYRTITEAVICSCLTNFFSSMDMDYIKTLFTQYVCYDRKVTHNYRNIICPDKAKFIYPHGNRVNERSINISENIHDLSFHSTITIKNFTTPRHIDHYFRGRSVNNIVFDLRKDIFIEEFDDLLKITLCNFVMNPNGKLFVLYDYGTYDEKEIMRKVPPILKTTEDFLIIT